jgi:quinol monooxygenase YgiN
VVIVIGRARCRPEQRDELLAAAKQMQDRSRQEEGCLYYGFFTAIDDPLSFVAVEEWTNREALDRHFEQPHLHEFSRRLGDLVSEPPEVAIHEAADG